MYKSQLCWFYENGDIDDGGGYGDNTAAADDDDYDNDEDNTYEPAQV